MKILLLLLHVQLSLAMYQAFALDSGRASRIDRHKKKALPVLERPKPFKNSPMGSPRKTVTKELHFEEIKEKPKPPQTFPLVSLAEQSMDSEDEFRSHPVADLLDDGGYESHSVVGCTVLKKNSRISPRGLQEDCATSPVSHPVVVEPTEEEPVEEPEIVEIETELEPPLPQKPELELDPPIEPEHNPFDEIPSDGRPTDIPIPSRIRKVETVPKVKPRPSFKFKESGIQGKPKNEWIESSDELLDEFFSEKEKQD